MTLRFACPECQVALIVRRNGVGVETQSERGPYQYFHGDLLECPLCQMQVLSNFGSKPIAEHYEQPRYAQVLEAERRNNTVYEVWYTPRDKERCCA